MARRILISRRDWLTADASTPLRGGRWEMRITGTLNVRPGRDVAFDADAYDSGALNAWPQKADC